MQPSAPEGRRDIDHEIPLRAALAFTLLLGAAAMPAQAGERPFLDRFVGSWSGSATVIDKGRTLNVSCQVTGAPDDTHISIRGHCNAGLIGRAISADLTFDPKSGRYSGTYIGDDVGPARLSGKRSGERVELTITWPKPVNGDTTAKMTIVNSGNGTLRITLNDKPAMGSMGRAPTSSCRSSETVVPLTRTPRAGTSAGRSSRGRRDLRGTARSDGPRRPRRGNNRE